MAEGKNRAKRSKTWNYEATIAEVEEIINQIESGSLPLEDVFDKFAIAVEQMRRCENFLNRGQEKMNLLIETLEEDLEF